MSVPDAELERVAAVHDEDSGAFVRFVVRQDPRQVALEDENDVRVSEPLPALAGGHVGDARIAGVRERNVHGGGAGVDDGGGQNIRQREQRQDCRFRASDMRSNNNRGRCFEQSGGDISRRWSL